MFFPLVKTRKRLGKNTIKMFHKQEILNMLNRLKQEFPERSGFKTYDADEELVIPRVLCINSYVFDLLCDNKTTYHIDAYMRSSNRSVAVQGINRTAVMILMLSSVHYSFNGETFPFCNNAAINQMWADIGQMVKGEHVCCTLVAVAARGRTHEGFAKRHATRCSVPPVSLLDIPTFERRPYIAPPPPQPPPPPRNHVTPRTLPPKDEEKTT